MSELTKGDLQFVVTRLPRDVRELLMQKHLFVGGGFIRETIAGNPVNDVDLFGVDKATLEVAAERLKTQRENAKLHRTDNAITLLAHPRLPVQFITRWMFDDPALLVASFDFTVCQAVVWYEKGLWRSCVGDAFYADLAARRLVYTHPVRDEEPGGSMMRVRKFLARGYNIQAFSLAGVIARLVGSADIRSADETGMTFAFSRKLVEVDPMLLIDGFEPVDEHEIINGETQA